MDKNWPRISIVTPVFNAGQFLESSIKSVLDQQYHNLEYIIIDGGSTDDTVDIIRKYDKHISYWETKPDRGQTHALNKGFSRATGVLRGWLNADEEYLPGTLECVGKEYMFSSDLDLLYGNRYFHDLTACSDILEKIPAIAPYPLMLYTGGLLFSDATFWSRKIHDKLGELNEQDYPRYAMDAEWLLRVTGEAVKWKYIDRPFSIFKYHDSNVTSEGIKSGLRYNEKIRRDYAKAHGISIFKLAAGWVFYSICRRCLEKGFLKIFTPPKRSTIEYLFLKKYNRDKQRFGK